MEEADDPANADWRTISARGTVLAKQGKYREAIPLYERALALAPNQASVLNNLALALTMEGKVEQAESLLKRAVAPGSHALRVEQNLALVLSLQGKYEEAKLLGAQKASAEAVTANVDYVKRSSARTQTFAGGGAQNTGKQRCGRPRAGVGRGRGGHLGLGHARRPGQARRLMAADSVGAGGFPQRRQGEQQGRQEPKGGR